MYDTDALVTFFANLIAGYLIYLVVAAIVGFICFILSIVAWWIIFKKAGEPGWKSIIPFYNYYIQLKITWNTMIFWIVLGLSVLSAVLRSAQTNHINILLTFFIFAISVANFVINIIAKYKLAKSFGHGAGFTVGLFFFPVIFELIIAFGKSEYIGNTTAENAII